MEIINAYTIYRFLKKVLHPEPTNQSAIFMNKAYKLVDKFNLQGCQTIMEKKTKLHYLQMF